MGQFHKRKNPRATKKSKAKAALSVRSSKEEKLYQNLLKVVEQFMTGKSFTPLSEAELLARLGLPPQHATLFHEVLNSLLQQNVIELLNERYRPKKVQEDIVQGIVRMHPRGFGFVQTDLPKLFPQDIFIPRHLTQNAVDGDRVEVQVNMTFVSEKGPEGRIIAILSRGRTHVAGIIREIEPGGEISAHVPMLGTNQRIIVEPMADRPLKVGDRVVMKVLDWGTKNMPTICQVSHYIGHITDPSCDIAAAIEEYELRADFPYHAIEEAKSFGKQVSRNALLDREDFRAEECFTIDPETAKDFDDALTLKKDKEGNYQLGVHIADVSFYVRPGTALDNEAKQRCNSTYFPGFCLPMLPAELSDNLCSLKPNVNRLTVSVLMQFSSDGTLLNYRMVRSVIKSAKRFSYREAKEILDGKKKSQHKPTLELMVELCKLLKRKRYERGSIEFSLPELVVRVDEKGVPVATQYVEYDITHQLVEEFMLKANELVALHLSNQGKNLTYRIHDEPAEEDIRDFAMMAGAFGFHLSKTPTQAELQQLFDEALHTPYGPYLATSYIRRMRLAIYSPDNIGHFGLGLSHYCHFTSPIRRYVDLVVHRILFGESDERTEIERIATQSSEQERISAKAESSVVLLKKLRLLQSMHEKEPNKQFNAVVTRVKNFGIFFEVLELMLEGFLHVSELDNDFYIYDEPNMRLRGSNTGNVFFAGEPLVVMLKDIDLILAEAQWHFVVGGKKESPPKRWKEKGKISSRPRSPLPPSRFIQNRRQKPKGKTAKPSKRRTRKK